MFGKRRTLHQLSPIAEWIQTLGQIGDLVDPASKGHHWSASGSVFFVSILLGMSGRGVVGGGRHVDKI
jgi:hypothetical protein